MLTTDQPQILLSTLDACERLLPAAVWYEHRGNLATIRRLLLGQAPAAEPTTAPAELNAKACRRLVQAVLLAACLDAGDGDRTAWQWICGPEAAHLADLADFGEVWPPALGQLGTQRELEARARELAAGARPARRWQMSGGKEAEAQLHLFRVQ